MTLHTATGTFNTGTGAAGTPVAVAGLGFTPKVVWFWWTGRAAVGTGRADQRAGYGYAVSPTDRGCAVMRSMNAVAASVARNNQSSNACVYVDQAVDLFASNGILDLQSMDSDGFTLVVDDPFTSDCLIHYFALGGSDVRRVAGGTFTKAATTGNQSVTGLGFTPNYCGFFTSERTVNVSSTINAGLVIGAATSASAQYVTAGGALDNAATMRTRSYTSNTECLALLGTSKAATVDRAAFVSMDPDGFTLNWVEATTTASIIYYVAIQFARANDVVLGDLLTQTDTSTPIAETGFGFSPAGALFISHGMALSTADTTQNGHRLSIGAMTSASVCSAVSLEDQNGVADSVVTTGALTGVVYQNLTTGAAQGAMDIQSVDADGFTCIMTDADPGACFVWYVAFGEGEPQWREHPYAYKGHLYLHQPATVFAAQVHASTLTSGKVSGTSIFQYIYVKTITTGTLAAIVSGMTLWLGSAAGLYDKGRCRVRDVRNVSGTDVIAVWVSPNVHDGELDLAENLYITVKDEYRPWMKPPYYPESGVGSYDGDNSWGGTTYHQFPVANTGPAYAHLVDPVSELITVSFDAANSYAVARDAVLGSFGADLTTGGSTAASSTTAPNVSGNAIDDSAATYWESAGIDGTYGETLSIGLGTVGLVRRIGITASTTTTAPNYFNIMLQTQDVDPAYQYVYIFPPFQTGWSAGETRYFYIQSDQIIQGIVLHIYSANGAANVRIAEVTAQGEDRTGGTSPYAWNVGDGTIIVGSTTTEQITATFPAGFRHVRLTVTDTNAYSGVSHVPVLAAAAGMAGLHDDFEIVGHARRAEGQELEVRILVALPTSSTPDNALALYWEDEVYNGQAGSLSAAGPSGREHMKFTGWIHGETRRVEVRNGVTVMGQNLRCLDIGGWLAELPTFPVVLMRKNAAVPAYIYECDGLCIDRFIYLVVRWLSNAAEIADVFWSGTADKYPVSILNAGGSTLYEQADALARHIGYRFTCNKQGQLLVKPDPNQLVTALRTSAVQAALTADDITALEYGHQVTPSTHWVWASGVAQSAVDYDGVGLTITTYFAVAPGQTPGQGVGSVDFGEQLVLNQTEINQRAGLLYARENAPQDEFIADLAHVGDAGIDPADMEWVTLTLGSTHAPRGLTFTAARFLPTRVTTTYDPDTLTKSVQITLERETDGPVAVGYTPA